LFLTCSLGAEVDEETPEEPNTDAWNAFVKCAVQIGVRGLHLGSRAMGPQEVEQYLRFVIHLFQSLEAEHVRGAVMRLASLPIWAALSESRRELELHRNPDAAKKWKSLAKKHKKAAAKAAAEVCISFCFIHLAVFRCKVSGTILFRPPHAHAR
jgi:Intron-binding protein aquarius N-terminus